MVVTVISAPFTTIFHSSALASHSGLIVGQFFEKSLTARQHILPRCLEIACVPRVGNIAGAVGVVHQEVQLAATNSAIGLRQMLPRHTKSIFFIALVLLR